jgi:hypothetical protein
VRMLVIGLDGAEYSVIEKGDYPHLKQAEFGTVEINVKPLFSPLIWASFITGKVKEEHEIRGMHKWRSGLVERLRNWSLETKMSRGRIGKGLVRLGLLLEFLGFKTRLYDKSDLGASTIFDYVDNHVAISIPAYNEDPVNHVVRRKEAEALRSGSRKLTKETEELVWRVFQEKREEVLRKLMEDWNLFMVHFYVLDPLQHLFWYDSERIMRAYEEADVTVKSIQDRMPDDCLMLIVSDHGHRKGMHTPYGFYSCNEKLKLKNPKITDFAEVIRSYFGLPSREEEIKIYQRLKDLGYV